MRGIIQNRGGPEVISGQKYSEICLKAWMTFETQNNDVFSIFQQCHDSPVSSSSPQKMTDSSFSAEYSPEWANEWEPCNKLCDIII
jgi:hypothetical protein